MHAALALVGRSIAGSRGRRATSRVERPGPSPRRRGRGPRASLLASPRRAGSQTALARERPRQAPSLTTAWRRAPGAEAAKVSHMRRLVVLAGVWVVALAAASVLSAATASPSVVPDCLGKPVVKPVEIILACADDGLGVRAIRWLGWGSPVAAGLGTAYANDCTPSCAAGHFHTYRAVLLLAGSQRCDRHVAYRTATVAIVGTPPSAWASASDATYPLRCAT
jgi:hypothetical protein